MSCQWPQCRGVNTDSHIPTPTEDIMDSWSWNSLLTNLNPPGGINNPSRFGASPDRSPVLPATTICSTNSHLLLSYGLASLIQDGFRAFRRFELGKRQPKFDKERDDFNGTSEQNLGIGHGCFEVDSLFP